MKLTKLDILLALFIVGLLTWVSFPTQKFSSINNPISIITTTSTQPDSIYTLLTGNIVHGALIGNTYYRTSSTLSTVNFCQVGYSVVFDSTSTSPGVLNLPNLNAIMLSTPQTGGCGPLPTGGGEFQRIYNSSTQALTVNASSGIVFKVASGTTGTFSSSSFTIPPQAVLAQDGYLVASTTFFILNTLWQ